jgi:hypothetical protein
MASTYKVLGQLAPSATTLSTLYTVPSATSTVCSTLVIANTGTTASTARVAIRPAGEAINTKHYIVYDVIVNTNDSVFLTLGLSLATTDVVTVYASQANLSFSLFGSEIA